MGTLLPIKYLMLMKQDFIGKKLPNRTYIAKDEKTASGYKASKDRITLLLCSNASGDRMLKPLLINKSLRPRALKGKDLQQLPVQWMANPKAWMTTAIFTEWFNNCFVAAVAEWYRYRIVACFVTSSSPVPLKTRRVGQRCTLNLSRAETFSHWCGVVVRRGGASSGVVHVT
ncbi:tigger transposable element-derived protein 1 [Trichonephila clavipes]|nr:tigger transposable element-derived protein 1 [Trichonephila clavipes]